MPEASWTIRVGSDETTAEWDAAPRGGDQHRPVEGTVYVCAHGAGGHMSDRAILNVSSVLQARGIGVVRFNFLYRAKRSGRPDPMPRLVDCWKAVIERVRQELAPRVLIVGGRSMGGRAASVLVADGAPADRVLLLAYPLHPPGQPQKLRVDHLPSIQVPVLCINGTRDPFCDPDLMKQTLAGLGRNWRMHWLEGADHSFHVLRSSGRHDRDVLAEAADEVVAWLSGDPAWRGDEG